MSPNSTQWASCAFQQSMILPTGIPTGEVLLLPLITSQLTPSSGGLPIHHLPLECNCAMLPGLAGSVTRKRMDDLAEAYDEAVIKMIREWDKEDDETFAAIW